VKLEFHPEAEVELIEAAAHYYQMEPHAEYDKLIG